MNYQQRSNEWYTERLGKFTASDISNILGKQGLGKTGESHCFKKACEIVFGIDEEEKFESYHMRRGIELEPLAFKKFQEIKKYDFLNVTEAFFYPYSDYAGASPDGNVDKNAVLEIKCPESLKLFNLIDKGIAAIDPVYYDQMQMQILCSNSELAYFFNYGIFKGKEIYHTIEVPRDNKRIAFIEQRLPEAKEKRDMYIQNIKSQIQFEL